MGLKGNICPAKDLGHFRPFGPIFLVHIKVMPLHIVLFEPEIPWNTGNIGRTCVAVGATLHLIGRLGFSLSEKEIRRSGLDYWPHLQLVRHDNFPEFIKFLPPDASVLAFSTHGKRNYWQAPYKPESYLLFGRESAGLPDAVHKHLAGRIYRIPMQAQARSLNLSTAAAVVAYEALRQTGGK